MRRLAHSTLAAQKHALVGEVFSDFTVGTRVATVDGYPGRITAVLDGPFPGTEGYEVILDGGIGGGQYSARQLRPLASHTAAQSADDGMSAEAATLHLAAEDYPELGTILHDRPPNERVKVYASRRTALATDLPGQSSTPESGQMQKKDQAAEQLEQAIPQVEQVEPPDACSFCGHDQFENPTNTGRGTRMECAQCGGTMTSWGGQWQPDPPSSPENAASRQGDPRATINDLSAVHSSVDRGGNDQPSFTHEFETQGPAGYATKRQTVHGPFYHGGRARLRPGAMIEPGRKPNSWGDDFDDRGRSNHAYFTTEPSTASSYAQSSGGHLYEVEPTGEAHYDSGGGDGSYKTKHPLRVIRRIPEEEWEQLPSGRTEETPPAPDHLARRGREFIDHFAAREQTAYDPDLGFHMLATWADVRRKAKAIRDSGGVRILAATGAGVVGEVQGEHHLYESSYNYVPGTRKVADWSCFLPDAPVTMADGTERPISKVQVGDRVITHLGNAQRVLRAAPKPYDGDLTTIKFRGDRRPVVATSNHEVWTPDGWREIGTLKPGDFLSTSTPQDEKPVVVAIPRPARRPVTSASGTRGVRLYSRPGYERWVFSVKEGGRAGARHVRYFVTQQEAVEYSDRYYAERDTVEIKLDLDLCAVLGWYAAEGFVRSSMVGYQVGFSLSADEYDVAERIDDIVWRYFGVRGHIRHIDNKIDYRVSDWRLHYLCTHLVGHRAAQKALHENMMTLPHDLQEAFVAAWINGDGHYEYGTNRITLSSVSETLIRQGRDLMARLGQVSTISWSDSNRGGLPTTQNAGRIFSLRWVPGAAPRAGQRRGDARIWRQIERVTATHYQGEVWDIEVAEDHSFRAYGIDVHNCGCKWGGYAWGRSPAYARFEGRQCSHVTALQYEAQSRGMFGRQVQEDRDRLPGQYQRSPVTVQYDRAGDVNLNRRTVPPGNMRRTFSSSIHPDSEYAQQGHDETSAFDTAIGRVQQRHVSEGNRLWHEHRQDSDHHDNAYSLGVASESALQNFHDGNEGREPSPEEHVEYMRGAYGDNQHPLWGEVEDEVRKMKAAPQQHESSLDLAPVHAFACEMIRAKDDPDAILKMLAKHGVAQEAALQITAWAATVVGDEDGGSTQPGQDIPGLTTRDTTELKKKPHHQDHHTNDSRRHAPDFGRGIGWNAPGLMWCDQCSGSGCGHCGGTGEVMSGVTPTGGPGVGDLSTTTSPVADDNPSSGEDTSGGISATGRLQLHQALLQQFTAALPDPDVPIQEGVWYHGSRHTHKPGDILTGGHSKSNQGYGQPGEHVYYTGRHDVASAFAEAGYGPERKPDAKPKVYTVEPIEGHEPDPDESEEAHSFRAKKVRVLGRVRYDHDGPRKIFGSQHTADYAVDSLGGSGMDQTYRPQTQHSNSQNPGSTGWATSADPGGWVQPIIGNDYGITSAASAEIARQARYFTVDELRALGQQYLADHPEEAALADAWQSRVDAHQASVEGQSSLPEYTHAGLALKAADTGRVLMIQRSIKDESDPARGTWEMPGGGKEPGDKSSLHTGVREWEEEVGHPFPEGGHVSHTWRSGTYHGHVVVIPSESQVQFAAGRSTVNPDDPGGDDHEQSAWWHPQDAKKNPALRAELKKNNPFGDIAKAAAVSTPCQTPEVIYDTKISDRTVGVTAEMPMDIDLDAQQAETLDRNLHNMMEMTLAPMFPPPYAPPHKATLNDEPEPALPYTDGGVEDDSTPEAGVMDWTPGDPAPGQYLAAQPEITWGYPGGPSPAPLAAAEASFDDVPLTELVAAFQATAAGQQLVAGAQGADTSAEAQGENAQIAAMARAVLAGEVEVGENGISKSAMKDFSFAEQQELISEGATEGTRARNFDGLQIEGTHYALLGEDVPEEQLWL